MSSPSNTFTTGSAVGNREDITDRISASNADAELGRRARSARFKRDKHASTEEMAKEFASMSPDEREELLDEMDDDLRSEDEVSFGSSAMRRLAEKGGRRRTLKNVHATLRRAGK